jgi:hypothetical protein
MMEGFIISCMLGLMLALYCERKDFEKERDHAYEIIALRDKVILEQSNLIKKLEGQQNEK